jgi:hypothetical protein
VLLERHAGQTVKNSYRQDGLVQNTCGAMGSRKSCYVIVGICELRAPSLLVDRRRKDRSNVSSSSGSESEDKEMPDN